MTPETYRDYSEHQAGFAEKHKSLVIIISTLQQQFKQYEDSNPGNTVLDERNRNSIKATELIASYSAALVGLATNIGFLGLEIDVLVNTINKLMQEIEPEASPENPFILDALTILAYQKTVLESHTLTLNNLLQVLEQAQVDLVKLEYLIKSEPPIILKTRAYIGSKLDKYGIPPRELESTAGQELLTGALANLPIGIDVSPNWKKYPGIEQINSLIQQYVTQHHPHKIPVAPVAMQCDAAIPETKPRALAISAFATSVAARRSMAARRSSSSVFFAPNDENAPAEAIGMNVDSVDTSKQSSKGNTIKEKARSDTKRGIDSMECSPATSRARKPLGENNGRAPGKRL